jgi:hypothetical protein
MSRLAIIRAVPAGSKRARTQRAYLRAVLADPVIAELRADARRAVLELARILARHADWSTMTSWRPRDLTCAEIGSSRDPSRSLSISAYKRARQVLEERGFLGLVAQGWTSALRAGPLDDRTATSAVFVLTIPGRRPRLSPLVNGPLAESRRDSGKALRTREARSKSRPEKARATRGCSLLPPGGQPALGAVPQNRSEARAVARAMQDRARLLRRISAEHLRHLVRPFFAAGWTGADVLHALDHEPGGRQHGYSAEVRSPAGWIRARLAGWLGPDAIPLPSRSQRVAIARAQVLTDQAARRERDERGRAGAGDYRARAAEARAMLARRPRLTGRPLAGLPPQPHPDGGPVRSPAPP